MKGLIWAALCLLFLSLPAGAVDTEEAVALQREELKLDELEREVRRELDGADLDMDNSWQENASELAEYGRERAGEEISAVLASCVELLLVAILCGLCKSALGEDGPAALAVDAAGALVVGGLFLGEIEGLVSTGLASMESMSALSDLLLPAVAALTAATGAISGASVRQMGAVLFSNLLLRLIHGVLIPMVYAYSALCIVQGISKSPGLSRIAALVKWAVVWVLTGTLLLYVGYLTLSGVVASGADAAAVKAAKFAISGAVPVVGGILADASETVLAAAGILRSSVGVFGMIAVLGVCVTPFLRVGVCYLAYKVLAALGMMFGDDRVPALIERLCGALGMILAMVGACGLILLIALVSSVTAVAG